MADDGIWADDGDELHHEASARRESHYNAGYRQGLDEGQHLTIQQGFDAGAYIYVPKDGVHIALTPGFAVGAQTGFLCGQLRAAAVTLEALPGLTLPTSIAAAQPQRAALRDTVCQGLLLESDAQVC